MSTTVSPVANDEIIAALSIDGSGHRLNIPSSVHTSNVAYRILRKRNQTFSDKGAYRVFRSHLYLRLQQMTRAGLVERDNRNSGPNCIFWQLTSLPAPKGGAA